MSADTFEFDDRNHAERFVGTLHDPAAATGDVLTVQPDKSIAAQPGGGGSGGVQVVAVPVSSAQILDLFNTPVTLIPGVTGSAIVPQGIAVAYVAGLVPYLDGGGNLVLGLAGGVGPAPWGFLGTAGLWDQATSQIAPIGFSSLGGASVASADCDGVDVVLGQDIAAPTLGDGTLLVTVSYFLAPTV